MSYESYWSSVEALDRVRDEHDGAIAQAEQLAVAQRTQIDREHQSAIEEAMHRESRAREALARGRSSLDRVGLQTRLPASVKPASNTAPRDAATLAPAVAELEHAVITLEDHLASSRQRRLDEAQRREADAAAARREAEARRTRELEAARATAARRQSARRSFGLVAALVVMAIGVAVSLATSIPALVALGLAASITIVVLSRRPVIIPSAGTEDTSHTRPPDRPHT